MSDASCKLFLEELLRSVHDGLERRCASSMSSQQSSSSSKHEKLDKLVKALTPKMDGTGKYDDDGGTILCQMYLVSFSWRSFYVQYLMVWSIDVLPSRVPSNCLVQVSTRNWTSPSWLRLQRWMVLASIMILFITVFSKMIFAEGGEETMTEVNKGGQGVDRRRDSIKLV